MKIVLGLGLTLPRTYTRLTCHLSRCVWCSLIQERET